MALVGEVLEVIVAYSSPGASKQLNIFNYIVDGSPDTDEEQANALNAHFATGWLEDWEELASLNSELLSIVVRVVNLDGTVNRDIQTYIHNRQGDQPTTVTSAAVSAYILAKTAVPKIRGSKYIPGIAEGRISDGEFLASAITTMIAMTLFYIASTTSSGGSILLPGVISKATVVFTEFIAAGAAESVPAYQRRRKPNVGD